MKKYSITCEQFKKRLSNLCIQSGLTGLPHKLRDRHILFKSMVVGMSSKKTYTEKEIDNKLNLWLDTVGQSMDVDHVTLRRQLIELGYLERNMDGSDYRLCIFGPAHTMFEPAVEEINIYEIITTTRELIEKRKQDYLRRQKEKH